MSNVSDILTAMATQISSVLPSEWKELDYIYSDDKNTFRTGENRYGAGVAEADTVTGVNKAVTFDQSFFVKLTDTVANRSSDDSERAAISNLYDNFELINEQVFQKKMGIPTVVLVVSDISMEEPQRIGDNTIMLRANFTIKHRKQTT